MCVWNISKKTLVKSKSMSILLPASKKAGGWLPHSNPKLTRMFEPKVVHRSFGGKQRSYDLRFYGTIIYSIYYRVS
jgi:hypothetical protein